MRIIRSILLPSVFVAAAFLVSWHLNRPVPAPVSSPAQVQREARQGGYRLIDVDALHRLHTAAAERITLVDTRQEWEYRAGHIQGSGNFPMEPSWWARWTSRAQLNTYLGPDKEKKIVFY